MSTLSVQIADLLPLMDKHSIDLRVTVQAGDWVVAVRKPRSGMQLWEHRCDELWQGLDAALAWIWREYGTREEDL